LQSLSLKEIAWQVTNNMIGEDLPAVELDKIIEHTIQFDAPLVRIDEDIYALELFHGPTLAFKDFGARFLSGLLGYYAKQQSKEITILVATSGDTGSAVANSFLRVPGTQVVVLYPSGKVSEIQEKQFTTLGENIIALEVEGTFDDCQRLVKQAFLDKELKQKLFLTSANSINIARLMPQSFYYFYAYAQLGTKGNPLVISVPSGNFGNLTAGLIAKKLGLPIKQFLAATNANKVVPEFLKTGEFKPRPSMQTISNAMDVGNPSNFPRMLELYNNDFDLLSQDITGYSFNDESTRNAMRNVYDKTGYCMDPHGAIGYQGLLEFKKSNSAFTGIFLETAHPAKFREVVEETIQHTVDLPERLKDFMEGEKKTIQISSSFLEFKSLLPTLLA
jgi:threonine synthase